MDGQALHPNSLGGFGSIENDPTEVRDVPTPADDDDIAINYVSQQKGWELIGEYIDSLIAELDSVVDQLMASNASFSEIGQKTAVGAVAKAYLGRVKTKVQNARDAVEEANG
jgi:hypothetical protein